MKVYSFTSEDITFIQMALEDAGRELTDLIPKCIEGRISTRNAEAAATMAKMALGRIDDIKLRSIASK